MIFPPIGKTVQPLGTRISKHRNPIKTLGTSMCIDTIEIDDTNTLAVHAIEHNKRTKASFNSLYKFFIIKHVEKEQLTISEQFFVNHFKTIRPYGLNVSNPIGLTNRINFLT